MTKSANAGAWLEIARRRLANQELARARTARPEAVVTRLVAVQAQDYPAAKWGVAQRTRRATDADLDRAFDRGAILRTHVLRPTWHFVTPADARWLLELTAPRVHRVNAYAYRRFELDAALLRRSRAVLARALRDGRALTRAELGQALDRAKIAARGTRLAYLVMHAELDRLICSGPRRGKLFTYALFDERVPGAAPLERDEALARLVTRYFQSHGPAKLSDFAWWSGLTLADARRGSEIARAELEQSALDGGVYFAGAPQKLPELDGPSAHLLPNYDEHLVAYRDHRASFAAGIAPKIAPGDTILNRHFVVVNGGIVGGWRSTAEREAVRIEARLLRRLTRAEARALDRAVASFERFLGLPARLELVEQR